VLLLCGINAIVYLGLLARLISNLRDSHHDVYVRLGEPSLFLNNNIANGMRLVGCILRGQFLQLEDKTLTTLGRACRALLILGSAGFAFCWVVLAYFWETLR
jgi:hypothetical protein